MPFALVMAVIGMRISCERHKAQVKAQAKERADRELLERNPEAWAIQKQRRWSRSSKRGQLGRAATTGLGIAWQILNKRSSPCRADRLKPPLFSPKEDSVWKSD